MRPAQLSWGARGLRLATRGLATALVLVGLAMGAVVGYALALPWLEPGQALPPEAAPIAEAPVVALALVALPLLAGSALLGIGVESWARLGTREEHGDPLVEE